MPPEEPIDAVEWKQPAPDGGSQGQIYRLADGRTAIVKFAQNVQGPRVLFNEFVSCRLAERLGLPINQSVKVLVHPAVMTQCPNNFAPGVHCGLIHYPDAAKTPDPSAELFKRARNAGELHDVIVFEQLVARGDSRQLLVYPVTAPEQSFAAYDYGYAFGGGPNWTTAGVQGLQPPPVLPAADALGAAYPDGTVQKGIIEKLRAFTVGDVQMVIEAIGLPIWGVSVAEGESIAEAVTRRARALVEAYDEKYPPKAEPKAAEGADAGTRGVA